MGMSFCGKFLSAMKFLDINFIDIAHKLFPQKSWFFSEKTSTFLLWINIFWTFLTFSSFHTLFSLHSSIHFDQRKAIGFLALEKNIHTYQVPRKMTEYGKQKELFISSLLDKIWSPALYLQETWENEPHSNLFDKILWLTFFYSIPNFSLSFFLRRNFAFVL